MERLGTKNRRQRGSVFIEALVSLFVLGMGAAAFFALLPTMQASKIIAGNQTVALQMSNRMIEQIQLLSTRDLNAATLSKLNLINPNQTSQPYNFSRVPLDEASRYSPAQVLRNGQGRMRITELESGAMRVEITISWMSEAGRLASITTGTIVGDYK